MAPRMSLVERQRIQQQVEEGRSLGGIARSTGRHKSTISRMVRRGVKTKQLGRKTARCLSSCRERAR